ncbi:MAG: hypothetical protein MJH11_05760 [Lentisphaeria bacterium]|nr:hypothetical protein [Lentisphaeria bacterium]
MIRLSAVIGIFFAVLCFGWHSYCGHDFMYSAWISLIVMLIISIVVHKCMLMIGNVLLEYLYQQAIDEEEEIIIQETEIE